MAKFLPLVLILALLSCEQSIEIPIQHKKSGAAKAMEEWALARSYPDGRIRMDNLAKAFEAEDKAIEDRDEEPIWEALGPKNIGGRTLCIAFHPNDPNIQYIGSASGGLWKTTTAGIGVEAWERIPLGHPVLGVSSIAINPDDTNVMYIGTGEVYNYTIAQPGIYNRLTRGSYGMGVLKTTDGGLSWEKTIDWSYSDMKGVWDIVINPGNTNTVFVTTTEGIYRSHNAGENWSLVHDFPMGVDLEMHPEDTSLIFATHGGYQSPEAGIFKSENGGDSFELISVLPNDFTGKSLIDICRSNSDVIYISMAEALEGRGLYRSNDRGISWAVVSTANVPTYQGWFAHDIAIKPDDPENVLWAGVETYQSIDGGQNFEKKTIWSAWDFGQVPVGGPEGPPNYAHADIHAIYYAPFDDNTVYLATDGGIFVSQDNGQSWEGRNGGYQTQQFYARFSSSASNPNLAMGGLQDNATAIYIGDDAWVRVIGGDGMGTAIHPTNEAILYGSAQNLNIRRSTNGGANFGSVGVSSASGEEKNFNGPFILNPQNPNVVYAGAQRLHRSLNSGDSWSATSDDLVDQANGNPILNIAIANGNNSRIIVTTSPLLGGTPGVFRSEDGGSSWTKIEGLPDRVAMEVIFHPGSQDTAYVVFSGFGTDHLYRSEDGGTTWVSISADLPDIPTNTVIIDPEIGTDIYIGNDLGVYASFDSGDSWELYSTNIASALMAMHLSISPVDRKLRIATHGLGVYETDLRDPEVISNVNNLDVISSDLLGQNYPNPVLNQTTIPYRLPKSAQIQMQLLDAEGRLIRVVEKRQLPAGDYAIVVDLSDLQAGLYYYQLKGNWLEDRKTFTSIQSMIVK